MSETLTSFELKDSDVVPTLGTAAQDKTPLICGAPGCTNAVVKPARGRTPKFCEEHKPANANRNATSGRSWARATEIETILTTYVTGLGTGLTLINRADGEVLVTGGPRVVHELVELAKTDKQIRKYLEWCATPGKYAPLTLAVAAVVLPIMGNHGMIPQLFVNIPSGGGE